MRNEYFIERIHSKIESISKWTYAVCDVIQGYMKNESFIGGVYSRNEFISKLTYVARTTIEDSMKKWIVYRKNPFKNSIDF